MTRRILCFLLMAGLVMLMVAACSRGGGEEEPADETPTATTDDQPEATTPSTEDTTPEDQAPPDDTPEEPQTPAADDATDDSAGVFAGASDALNSLASYSYITSFTFIGDEQGEIESGSYEMSGAVVNPDRQHIRWRDMTADEAFELIEISSQMWISEEGEWEEIPVVAAQAMTSIATVFAPSAVWEGLYGELETDANYVGRETVNGISTRHYTTTYQHIGPHWEGELQDASGDVWIADEGYPVKYRFTATGLDEDGERGTIVWTMELDDVNEDLIIEAPL
jgi:hypothetical protein